MRIYIVVLFLLSTVTILKGQTAEYYIEEGLKKAELQNHLGAIAEYNKALELDPNNSFLYTDRGASKQLLEDYRGAIEDFNKAIKIDPKNKDAYYLRAFAKIVMMDIDGGCLDFSKAGELGHKDSYKSSIEFCK